MTYKEYKRKLKLNTVLDRNLNTRDNFRELKNGQLDFIHSYNNTGIYDYVVLDTEFLFITVNEKTNTIEEVSVHSKVYEHFKEVYIKHTDCYKAADLLSFVIDWFSFELNLGVGYEFNTMGFEIIIR